mgnify:CR=1 FL=1
MKIQFPKIDQTFFDLLLNHAMKAKEAGADIYNQSYQHFTGYFDKVNPIGLEHFYIGVYFTYGWMPTIPEIKLEDSERLINCLNLVKSGNILPVDDLEFFKGVVNNSIVGGSKLLHFIRPDKYPIWDSNIAGFFKTDGKLHAYAVNDIRIYRSYMEFVQNVIENQRFNPCFDAISQCFNYPITPVRGLEYILFSTVRNNKKVHN